MAGSDGNGIGAASFFCGNELRNGTVTGWGRALLFSYVQPCHTLPEEAGGRTTALRLCMPGVHLWPGGSSSFEERSSGGTYVISLRVESCFIKWERTHWDPAL